MSDPVIAALRDRRMHLGLTQRDLADALGVQQSSISDWESGTVVPRLTTLHRWAEALGLAVIAQVEELRGQRDEAREQRNLARRERNIAEQVVEAAEAYVEARFTSGAGSAGNALTAAVDAWRAAQPDPEAPTDRPNATESQDQGADDGAGTEGSQAQGGVQVAQCEPYANGQGWFHTVGCSHVDWSEDRAFIDANPNRKPAPADPAGLDAAIEAARTAPCKHMDDANYMLPSPCLECRIRAAAPHLRAAALSEAADEIERAEATYARLAEDGPSRKAIVAFIRERAGREIQR